VRETVDAKPFTAVTVMVEVPEEEVGTENGLAEKVKSWAAKVIVAERNSDPALPVTMTV
jgi:hypothetical protein